MRIFEKNILRLLIKNTFISMSVLLIIFILFEIVDELSQVNVKNYTFASILVYVLFKFGFYITKLISLSVLIGAILTVANLNSNRELIILQSGSISKIFIGKKILIYGFSLSLVLLIFVELLNPFQKTAEEYKSFKLGESLSFDRETNIWLKDGKNFIYAEDSINGKDFEGLLVFNFLDNKINKLIRAERGSVKSDNLQLHEVDITFFERGFTKNVRLNQELKKHHTIKLENLNTGSSFSSDLETLSIYSLFKKILLIEKNGLNSSSYQIALYERILIPFSSIAMLLVGLPFVFKESRNLNIQKSVFIGLNLGFIFHLISKSTIIISTKQSAGIFLFSIFPVILFVIVGLVIFRNIISSYD